nr:GNAT family N-acetyltransferase [Escherichia coli]
MRSVDGDTTSLFFRRVIDLVECKSILEKTLTRWPVFVDHFTYTRQGYAIEAITATIDWIKENGFSLIKAGVNPENTLSKKLLIRIGFNFSSIEDG